MVEPHTPPVPTSSSSTNVIVPNVAATPRLSYLEWDGIIFILVGIFAALTAVSKLMEFAKGVHEFLERKRKRDRDQDAPLEARLKFLEEASKNFRPKEDLERDFQSLSNKVDHEKENRRMVQENFDNRLRNMSESQAEDRVARTKLEAKVEALTANSERVEKAVDALGTRINDRFDQLYDAILAKQPSN